MKKTLLTLMAVALASLVARAEEPLKILSYNLRFGELATVEQLGDFVASQEADFVALQECDWATKRERAPHQHGVKFVNEIAHRAGMFGLYGKAINYKGGYYGVGILSRYPIIKSERVLLPQKPKTEQRTLLVATAELPSGDLLTFVSTHLEVSSSEARMEQVEFINRYFDEWPHPVILVGDMNAEPHTKEMQALVEAGWKNMTNEEKTYSTKAPKIKIDYIFYRGARPVELRKTEVVEWCTLSDHFPVVSIIDIK
jgi:endonuclease/exonuclease/phosphatase family metal-dependent hydrolase